MPETLGPQPSIYDARDNMREAISGGLELAGPRRRCFDQVVLDSVGTATYLGRLVDETFKLCPELGPSEVQTRLRRYFAYAMMDTQLGAFPSGFPEEFTTESKIREGIEFITSDRIRRSVFELNVMFMNLQSNLSDRYKGLKLALLLGKFAGRLCVDPGGACNILDVGTSTLLGPKHLLGGPQRFALGLPDFVLPRHLRSAAYPEGKPGVAGAFMNAVHRLLQQELDIDKFVGMDEFHPRESANRVRACSFELDELDDPDRVGLFDALRDFSSPRLGFYRGDFADFEMEDFKDKNPGFEPDVIFFSSSLYETRGDEARQKMIEKALKIAKLYVVVQDYLVVENGKVIIRSNWRDNRLPYRTAIVDAQGAHEIARWSDSRVMRMAPANGKIAAASGGAVSMTNMLRAHVSKEDIERFAHEDIVSVPPHLVTSRAA
ncbi:MAG TPA: hypothetical protein VLG47_02565 [Candidatus Saccharimonadales bacterium]|nr:hypothetical protein [Candidatus Saccharimonadales bacterium]